MFCLDFPGYLNLSYPERDTADTLKAQEFAAHTIKTICLVEFKPKKSDGWNKPEFKVNFNLN